MGHFRPLILIPLGLLEKLPAVQNEAILLHELAHIRRCDYLVNTLQRIVEGLFFYHPAAWWISRLIRIEREHCCDDLVVATQHNAPQYAAALAALEETRWSRDTAAATVSATGGNLVNRIQRLLHPHHAPQTWTPLLAALVLLLTAAAAVAAWQQPPTTGTTDSPYLRWLNQDVVYIIADEERAAFTRLTTDPERDRFIEQFWLRRDPTPNTPNNEFKVEHYRRISYANQRFPTQTKPGWQTDRGRLYIVYGPPDEIESHPSGSATTRFPYEVWLYHHVEGIGNNLFLQFIDKTGSGDYRSAPSPR
jgi:GWxTD domain-containing protein